VATCGRSAQMKMAAVAIHQSGECLE